MGMQRQKAVCQNRITLHDAISLPISHAGKTFLALMKDFRAETAYAAFQGYEPPSILDQD